MLKLKKITKITFVMLLLCMLVTYMVPFNTSVAATNMTVTGPSIVVEGQSAVFNVKYSNDVIYINLSTGDIVLNGFQATVSVEGAGNTRKIILNNIRGTGNGRSISIRSGTGYVGADKIGGTVSNTFKIKSASEVNNNSKPVTPPANTGVNKPVQKPTVNNNNNVNNNTITNNENNQTNTNTENVEQPKEEVKEEDVKQEEEVKEENINYDEVIPIPNTGK